MQSKRFFSQLTAGEQLAVINIYVEEQRLRQRQDSLQLQRRATVGWLESRQGDELCSRPVLTHVAELISQEMAAMRKEKEDERDAAARELEEIEQQLLALMPELVRTNEARNIVKRFADDSGGVMPVVYDDVAWGDALTQTGIAPFVEIVRQELEETRVLLAEHNPPALAHATFDNAATCIGNNQWSSKSVYEAAEELRQIRTDLAGLRQEANQA